RGGWRGAGEVRSMPGALRREEHELGELARREPGKAAPLTQPAQRQPAVAVQAMPSENGGVERLCAHRLDGIAVNRLDLPQFGRHVLALTSSRETCISVFAYTVTSFDREKYSPCYQRPKSS